MIAAPTNGVRRKSGLDLTGARRKLSWKVPTGVVASGGRPRNGGRGKQSGERARAEAIATVVTTPSREGMPAFLM